MVGLGRTVKQVRAGPITCDPWGCRSEREDELIRRLRAYPPVPFYPPGYRQRGWRAETVSVLALWQLAEAQRGLKQKKMLNPVAEKYMLANALVEGRFDRGNGRLDPTDFGVNMSDDKVYERLGRVTGDPALGSSWSARSSLESARTFAETSQEARLPGLIYALTFEHKTGGYADAVYKGGASESQRVSLWNGRGKTYLKGQDGKRTKFADADNHARKVEGMRAVLNHEYNRELVTCWEKLLEGRLP